MFSLFLGIQKKEIAEGMECLFRLYRAPGFCLQLLGGDPATDISDGIAAAAKSLQSCPTLCDPIDGSPSGSPVPGILQTRTLE